MPKQRTRLRIDPGHVDKPSAAIDFAKDWASGSRTDDRVLRVAGLLGKQAARDLLLQAANDNEPDGVMPDAEPQS